MPHDLGWGVLGAGAIARRFAGQLPLSQTGRLAAVGSRSLDKARAFAEQFGPDAAAHGSYQDLLDDPAVQAVYVATPHPQHAEWAIKAAEAGKHVLCEKPLTLNRATAEAVVEAARANRVALMEAFMYRCHPQTRRLVELVESGAVGRVQQIQASFSFAATVDPEGRLFDPALGGGGILDVGCYPVSMARLLAGAAAGQPFLEPTELTAAATIGAAGVDEWATATLRFASGVDAHVACGVRLAGDNTVRVVGSAGVIDVPTPWTPNPDAPSVIRVRRVGEPAEDVEIAPAAAYALEADALAAAAAGDGQAPPMSWNDTLGNLAALDEWRAEIGLVYPAERDHADIPTAHGRPLARRPEARMAYGELPGVGKPVSRLVMGVDNQGTLPHATVMFDDFLEQGGTAFDTAYIYGGGRRERLLGQWIRNRGVRDDVVVIGKGAHTPHCDPDSLTRQLHESLDRLQTDHVDLYLMHRDNPDVPVGEFVDVLDQHRAAGRIHAYGGSNWPIERFAAANDYAAAHGKHPFAALSNHFSLAEALDVPWEGCRHVSDPESRAWLTSTQTPLLPWSSQARGFFAGRADPADRSDPDLVRCYYSDANFARLARARQLADEFGVPPTAIALAYVLRQPFPTFALIGPRHLSETRSSLRALDIDLTPDHVRWLENGPDPA